MAWYSLYKWFRSFRKIPYTDCIAWYRNHLYEEWFCDLTEEEQRKEELKIRKLKEKEDAGFQQSLLALGMLFGLIITEGCSVFTRRQDKSICNIPYRYDRAELAKYTNFIPQEGKDR